ncbi:MAG: lysine 5,6-aminomutase reactivase ATPase KamC [Vulcanimicrobiaceae bacterium]
MRLGGFLDDASAQAIDVAWFRNELLPVSEYGRRAFETLHPFAPGHHAEAAESARRIAELAAKLDDERIDALRDCLAQTPDMGDSIARISVGRVPMDSDLLLMLRACDALSRVDTLLESFCAPCSNDATRALATVIEQGRSGRYGFYLDATFDDRLREARVAYEEAASAFELARSRIAGRVAQHLGRERIESDEFIVMRDTLTDGLPQSVHIIREAPTYFLCELELDEAALVLLAGRDATWATVALEEEAVRERIAGQIRSYLTGLVAALARLGDIDLLVAQARFARRFACVVPEYTAHAQLVFVGGRFLPLQNELRTQGRQYVKIDVDLDALAVLTGPNMGGKSVCLRTCASIAFLAAFGLPVPADSARIGLAASIAWLGIGAESTRGGLLSAFAGEVLRLRDVLAATGENGLVFIDEFARTTNPAEGVALLVAIIASLSRRGCIGFVATHLAGIAAAAHVPHFAVRGLRNVPKHAATQDLAAVLAALGDAMDYRIGRVAHADASHADAIALASLLGIESEIITEAYAAFHAAHEEKPRS